MVTEVETVEEIEGVGAGVGPEVEGSPEEAEAGGTDPEPDLEVEEGEGEGEIHQVNIFHIKKIFTKFLVIYMYVVSKLSSIFSIHCEISTGVCVQDPEAGLETFVSVSSRGNRYN